MTLLQTKSNQRLQLNDSQQAVHDQIVRDLQRGNCKSIGLFGYAGVGKTVTTGAIIKSLNELYPEGVIICATTHKASRELEKALMSMGIDRKCSTIHRILGLRLVRDMSTGKESYQPNPKKATLNDKTRVVILDEASMLSKENYTLLMESLRPHQSVIFVGDDCQLPPVSDGKLCPAFQNETTNRIYKLTKVVRHDGPILQLATATRKRKYGRIPFVEKGTEESQVVSYPSLNAWKEAAINFAASEESCNNTNYTRILAWTNKNVVEMNRRVREELYGDNADPFIVGERLISHNIIVNPEDSSPLIYSTTEMTVHSVKEAHIQLHGDTYKELAIASHGENLFKEGKKQCEEWQSWIIQAEVPGMGTVGFRVLDPSEISRWRKCQKVLKELAHETSAKSDRRAYFKTYFYRKDSFGFVQPAAALTIHKSQGSTYKHVFLHPDLDGCRESRTKNRLAYVGITRAAQTLHVVKT